MLFSVIYEFECGMGDSIRKYLPRQRRLFITTERSDGEKSDWCSELWGGKCRHRKLCAVLTKDQFKRFLDDTGLFIEDCRTMGSLGAPGCGFGLSPAVSFSNDDPDSIQSAYVTPLPLAYSLRDLNNGPRRQFAEDDFERVRKAMLSVYS